MSDLSTVRSGESLVLGNGVQLALLEADELGLPPEAYQDLEQRGRFTGERLFSQNPSLYRAIVKLLSKGEMTYREIADVCGVSVNTVCGISFREAMPIETLRERLGRMAFDVSELSLEALRDLLSDPEARKKISARDLAIINGIATEKGQLMLGGATSRNEQQVPAAPSHEAYFAYVRNVTPATGSAGETPEQKAAPDAPGDVIVIEAGPAPASIPPEPKPQN